MVVPTATSIRRPLTLPGLADTRPIAGGLPDTSDERVSLKGGKAADVRGLDATMRTAYATNEPASSTLLTPLCERYHTHTTVSTTRIWAVVPE